MQSAAPMWPNRLAALGMTLLCTAACGEPPAPPPPGDRIVIDTRARTLTVYAGERALRQFSVSLARGGVGKVRQGDHRNPIGTYRLMKGRPSRFHRFLPVSYPNAGDAARGLSQGLVTRAEAEQISRAAREGKMPPQGTRLGGAIGVHGLGKPLGIDLGPLEVIHRAFNASDGCFMLTNAEIEELERLYVPGAVLEVR